MRKKATKKETKKGRYTSYYHRRHLDILNEISDRTGRPISSLIGEALDYFLSEKLGILEAPLEPPIDVEYYKMKMRKKLSKEV